MMPDREKVIKDLDELYRLIYQSNVDGEILGSLHDALVLLKEQEAETELCERCGRVRLKSKWEGLGR